METISGADSIHEIMERAVSVIRIATGAGCVVFSVAGLEGGGSQLVSDGVDAAFLSTLERFDPWPAENHRVPVVIPCRDKILPDPGVREIVRERGFVALCAVPLAARNKYFGHCIAFFTDADQASAIPFQTLVTICGMVVVAFDRKEADRELLQRENEAMVKMETHVIDRTRELSEINRILMTEITERKRTEEKFKAEISERRKVEESLRVLSQHLVDAQESERRRLSQELHDGVNQILSATKLRILSIYEKLNMPARTAEQEERIISDIEKARALIDESIKEIRSISRNLRPSVLDHLGLLPALRMLCEDLRDSGFEISFKAGLMPARLTDTIDVTLYRIIQECLTNIVKHSGATRIAITLNYRNSMIEAVIKDNGKGFDLDSGSAGNERSGYGLVSIKERGLYVGGTVSIASRPGKGTKIIVNIPFTEEQHHPEGTSA